MPLKFVPKRLGDSGALVEGAQATGALLVGSGGRIASLAMGDPGQVQGTDNEGALAWMTPMPGSLETIPTASGALLGMVRSSDRATPDSVAVDSEGRMTVNNLNVSKLYVPDGDAWILRAGTAE